MSDQPATNEKSSDEQAKLNQLIHLLQFEIDRIHADQRQPGWTAWAIFGAVGSLAWLAMNQIEISHLNAISALFVTLVIHLNYIFVETLLGLFSPATKEGDRGPRVRPANAMFGSGRVSLLWTAIRVGILLTIAITNPLVVSDTARYLTCLVLLAFVCLVSTVLIVSFCEIPFADPSSQKDNRAVQLVRVLVTTLLGGAAVWLMLILYDQFNAEVVSLADIRFGSLLFVVMELLSILARDRRPSPLLSTLIDIRRKLGLGEIAYDAARKQTEIALVGLTVSDLLQTEANDVLTDMRVIYAEVTNIQSELNAMAGIAADSNNDPNHIANLIVSVHRSTASRYKEINETLDRRRNRLDKLMNRIDLVRWLAPQAGKDLNDFVGRLKENIEESWQEIRKSLEQLKTAVENLGKNLPSATDSTIKR